MKQEDFKQKCIELQLKYDLASRDAKDFEGALNNVRRAKEYWQQESKRYKEALMNVLYWDCEICKKLCLHKKALFCTSIDKLIGSETCKEVMESYIQTVLNDN